MGMVEIVRVRQQVGMMASPAGASDAPDPLLAVLDFGKKAVRTGLIVGFTLAGLSHGAVGGRALAAPVEMQRWVEMARQEIHSFLWGAYDVDLVKPESQKPPEPPKEEKPEEQTQMALVKSNVRQAPSEPPPPAAQAGKVLTAPTDPNEPVDLTADGFVQGDAESYVGGVTAAAGTGTAPTYNPHAAPSGGVPGGKGSSVTAPVASVGQGPDLSKPPGIGSAASWSSCEFPPEADQDQVDYAVVTIVVTVRPDGSPLSVRVLNDPGHGFGRAARLCALSKQFTAGTDRDGNPVMATTPPIQVTFTR